jgi:hypothetical protein
MTTGGNGLPRIITLMGSGELSPTMVKVHRHVLERLGARPVPSLFLGTPFAFQENAYELSGRAVKYFDESLQTSLETTPIATNWAEDAAMIAKLRSARYVFSGPGSPTYALRAWQGSAVAQLLTEKLIHGGAVTFASAAALTLGAFTVPVYEIYKVGEAPHWLDGLDVLGAIGLNVAVVPHYNNAEGGTHDTRFCYLGEHRLAAMEEQLPADAFVLGIDEHTALVMELDTGEVSVEGLGVVTVRKNGLSVTYETGSRLPFAALAESAFAGVSSASVGAATADPVELGFAAGSTSPLFDLIHEAEQQFDDAILRGDARGATDATLGLERDLHDWSTDIPGQDELTRARASVRAMVGRLGDAATGGLRDPREVVAPFVELLIAQRAQARSERRFSDADRLREDLERLGIELRDSANGTEWVLREALNDGTAEPAE